MIAAHEPFFDLHSRGRVEIDGAVFTTSDELLNGLRSRTAGPDLFVKETTDHRYEAVLADRRFLAEARHAFLIRRPAEIAASYHALYPEMRQHEVGLELLNELHTAVIDVAGHEPVVIDSDDLVANPAATMAAYCDAVGLPFLPHALSWTPGDRPEWRQTARWHTRTASTSGFEPGARRYGHDGETSKRLAAFAAHHQPFYDRLRTLRLSVSVESE